MKGRYAPLCRIEDFACYHDAAGQHLAHVSRPQHAPRTGAAGRATTAAICLHAAGRTLIAAMHLPIPCRNAHADHRPQPTATADGQDVTTAADHPQHHAAVRGPAPRSPPQSPLHSDPSAKSSGNDPSAAPQATAPSTPLSRGPPLTAGPPPRTSTTHPRQPYQPKRPNPRPPGQMQTPT